MARPPRLVVAGQPLHIIHRGNNRQAVFFGEEDYQRFLSDLTEAAGAFRCNVHAYVLMTIVGPLLPGSCGIIKDRTGGAGGDLSARQFGTSGAGVGW